VVHAEVQQAKRRWERWASATSAWIAGSSPGNDERERTKEIRRRNADRRNEYSAVANGHGRARSARRTSIGVPPRFSSQGVFHRKGLSTRLSLPGTWRPVWLAVERALPAPTCPSPANAVAPRLMPKCRPGAGCKAARGHRTRPREPGMPPGRDRIIRRDSKPYVTVTVTIVNEKRTKYFHAP